MKLVLEVPDGDTCDKCVFLKSKEEWWDTPESGATCDSYYCGIFDKHISYNKKCDSCMRNLTIVYREN